VCVCVYVERSKVCSVIEIQSCCRIDLAWKNERGGTDFKGVKQSKWPE